jgi:nucleoside-diphosphate-sugar epimerase
MRNGSRSLRSSRFVFDLLLMSRVFITGASGFIGSAVARHLAGQGMQVHAGMRQNHAQAGVSIEGCETVECDVLSPPSALPECDALIHCATANDIVSRDFRAGVDLSVNGTRHLLELARKAGVRKVIFMSTVQVNGTELKGRYDESTAPVCETPYALNHLLGEEVCRMTARSWPEVDMALVRPANVYGVPSLGTVERSTLVPMCFVKQALADGRLTLRSSGLQRRNFISTHEVALACEHLLRQSHQGARLVLAGSAWHASIREIAEMTAAVHAEVTGTELVLEFQGTEPAEGNEFQLISAHLPHFLTPEESRARMIDTIRGLYAHFRH